MSYVTSEQIADRIAEVLEVRFEKWKRDLHGCAQLPPFRAIKRNEFAGPNPTADLPKAFVTVETRRSERGEQDTGEYVEWEGMVRVWFDHKRLGDQWYLEGLRYGDAVMYCINKEAKLKRPKDATVLPGFFRIWATDYQTGQDQDGAVGATDIRFRVWVDSAEAYAL